MSTSHALVRSAASEMSWANTTDRTSRTHKGREAAFKRFEDMVDPEGLLPEEERRIRAEHMRRAHMKLLAQKSRKARAAHKSQ